MIVGDPDECILNTYGFIRFCGLSKKIFKIN